MLVVFAEKINTFIVVQNKMWRRCKMLGQFIQYLIEIFVCTYLHVVLLLESKKRTNSYHLT